jgi:hypothetical protein
VNAIAIKPVWIGDRIQGARDAIEDVLKDDKGNETPLNPDLQPQAATLLNYPYGTAEPPAPPPDGPPSTNFPYAFGKFDSVFADAHNVCTASSVAPSELTYPVVPKHLAFVPLPDDPDNVAQNSEVQDEAPATTVKYAWSNFRALVSADSIGTQSFADLTITRDGCSANYKVAILLPLVECAGDDGKGNAIPDQTLCDPNPTDTNFYGSGIGVGIDTQCQDVGTGDSPSFVCVPTRTSP